MLMQAIETIMDKKVKTSGEFQLTDALQEMIGNGEKFTPFAVDNWYDCGKPETILSTNQTILQKYEDNSDKFTGHPDSKIIPPVFIDKEVVLENCVIGPFVSVGKNCTIRNSVISDSIIFNNAMIENYSLKHSIIGANTELTRDSEQINIGDYTKL